MDKSTRIALIIGTTGLAVNRYQDSKLGSKPYLSESEQQLKMGGGAVAFLGLTSAVILHTTKNHPKARKIAFVGLGVLSVGAVISILYALKKMT